MVTGIIGSLQSVKLGFLKELPGKYITKELQGPLEIVSAQGTIATYQNEFARSQRINKIVLKAQKRVLETLFFWHYDFSLRTKLVLTCLFFAACCVCLTMMVWLGRTAPTTATAVIAGILMLCFLISVVMETRNKAALVCGVITARDVVAHQGDGQNYPMSFKESLHAGAEFNVLERRPRWLHIRLPDDNDGWIPNNMAELI